MRKKAIRKRRRRLAERSPRRRRRWRGSSALYYLLERGDAFDCDLFHIARHLVRLAAEKPKPNADRLREYRDARLKSLEFQLFSPAPIHPELERVRLAGSLSFLAEQLGGDASAGGQGAGRQVPGRRERPSWSTAPSWPTWPSASAWRRAGRRRSTASTDPLIALAKLVDEDARKLRKRHEDEVEEVDRQAQGQIATARFELLGTASPRTRRSRCGWRSAW